MKKCFKCGVERPLTEFYKHPKMKDGRVNKCKECNKRDVRKNRAENVEYYREYDRKRYREDPSFKQRIAETTRRWNKSNPLGYKAHYLLGNAIRDGRLKKGVCEICGDKNVHGHHDDYNKPLDVRWLCPAHHRQHHVSQHLGDA